MNQIGMMMKALKSVKITIQTKQIVSFSHIFNIFDLFLFYFYHIRFSATHLYRFINSRYSNFDLYALKKNSIFSNLKFSRGRVSKKEIWGQ
jgi:hypothetical protein